MTWKCFYCGEEIEEIKEVKCPQCGRRTLTKKRPQIVEKVKTD